MEMWSLLENDFWDNKEPLVQGMILGSDVGLNGHMIFFTVAGEKFKITDLNCNVYFSLGPCNIAISRGNNKRIWF